MQACRPPQSSAHEECDGLSRLMRSRSPPPLVGVDVRADSRTMGLPRAANPPSVHTGTPILDRSVFSLSSEVAGLYNVSSTLEAS